MAYASLYQHVARYSDVKERQRAAVGVICQMAAVAIETLHYITDGRPRIRGATVLPAGLLQRDPDSEEIEAPPVLALIPYRLLVVAPVVDRP